MTTVINIDGDDVEFTDSYPTECGSYWYQSKFYAAPALVRVMRDDRGELYAFAHGKIRGLNGTWSAKLIPSSNPAKALSALTAITSGHFYQSSCRGGEMERLMNEAIKALGGGK